MREDFGKILTEKVKSKPSGKNFLVNNRRKAKVSCKAAAFDGDTDVDGFMGSRIHTSGHGSYESRKSSTLNMNALRRFLHSKVGKKWDDVYSEIMEGLNLNNLQHLNAWRNLVLYNEVAIKTYMSGNTVMNSDYFGPKRVDGRFIHSCWEFYVDPHDGTLCCFEKVRTKDKWREKREEEINKSRYIEPKNSLIQYHKVKGIWYEFSFREASEEEKKKKSFGKMAAVWNYTAACCDYVWTPVSLNNFVGQIGSFEFCGGYHRQSLWDTCKDLFGGHYLPISKQQISSKEVKRIEAIINAKSKKAA